ncbi:MAG TPA: tetratricopeptide repeat protein [Actinoplanes sp.]
MFLPKRHARPRREHRLMSADENLSEQVRQARLHLADAATELGTVLIQRGDHAEAEALLRRAISIYEANGAAEEYET